MILKQKDIIMKKGIISIALLFASLSVAEARTAAEGATATASQGSSASEVAKAAVTTSGDIKNTAPAAEGSKAPMIVGGPATATPKYLSVPNFRDCMGSIDHDGWSGWCMLKKRPDNCSRLSWNALQELGENDKPQLCESDSELPTTPREDSGSK